MMKTIPIPTRCRFAMLKVALLTSAALIAGCGAMYGLPGTGSGLRLDPARVNALLATQDGLCTGQTGEVSACVPRPQPKWDLGQIKVPTRFDVSQLPPKDRPTWVLCRINYQEKPPRWECAEIYQQLP